MFSNEADVFQNEPISTQNSNRDYYLSYCETRKQEFKQT